jgi:hypothetical protein
VTIEPPIEPTVTSLARSMACELRNPSVKRPREYWQRRIDSLVTALGLKPTGRAWQVEAAALELEFLANLVESCSSDPHDRARKTKLLKSAARKIETLTMAGRP